MPNKLGTNKTKEIYMPKEVSKRYMGSANLEHFIPLPSRTDVKSKTSKRMTVCRKLHVQQHQAQA